jgi:xylulokinase
VNLLGLDIGTGGSRAIVIGETGHIFASATVEHQPFASPQIGWAEQSPADWWRASSAAIRQVLTEDGVSSHDIGAVSFSGQMHGSVLLDEKDEVLRPALLWCDQRTAKQCHEITEKIGGQRLIELISNPAVTGFTLPKLLWVRENEPQIWSRVRSVLLPKDYVRFRLTGEKAVDMADASGTLLLNVRERAWSKEVLDELGIDASLLPPLYESTEIVGKISRAGAEATGLKEGTPVGAGAGDNAAGAIGMGIVAPGTVSVTIGTSGVVFVVTDKPTIDLKGRIHSLCHAIPNRWHMTGVTLAAGQSLKWFRDTLGAGKSYDELTNAAAAVPAGSDGAIWLPYLMGERTPHPDPHARAAFVGLTASHTAVHMARAVLEGVAFSLRDSLEIFREIGAPIDTIRVGGGGARSPLWQQIQADVYGHAVETIEADEGAAFGAAILAGVGAGTWGSVNEACSAVIRVAGRTEPDAKNVEVLERNYQAYTQLYTALRPSMNIITGVKKDERELSAETGT